MNRGARDCNEFGLGTHENEEQKEKSGKSKKNVVGRGGAVCGQDRSRVLQPTVVDLFEVHQRPQLFGEDFDLVGHGVLAAGRQQRQLHQVRRRHRLQTVGRFRLAHLVKKKTKKKKKKTDRQINRDLHPRPRS